MSWRSTSRSRRRWRRQRRRIGFALAPAALLVIGAELAARVMWEPRSYDAGGPLGWTMRPDLDALPVDQEAPQLDFTVSTNGDGLRTDYERDERGAGPRLVTFGDSTIFGWGLAAEHAPAPALEALLAAERGGAWQVVNAGQPGYSSEQARRLAEALLPAWAPDGVIWFHPWHDVAEATPDRELLPEESAGGIWAASAALSWLQDRRRQVEPQAHPLFPLATRHGGASVRVPPDQRAENLERLADAAERADAWLLVALLPNEMTLGDPRPAPLAEELAGVCEGLGLPFLDLSREPRGVEIEAITLPGDPGHFTAETNRLFMARVLAQIPPGSELLQ